MNRPFYNPASNSSSSNTRQPPLSLSSSRPPIQDRYHHSRNSSDPAEYQRRASANPSRYDDEDTEDAEEDYDQEMTQHGSGNRTAIPQSSSRPGSSHRDTGAAPKKPKSKSTKIFQCTGYGDCTMQFTRSEHLARHIRYFCFMENADFRKHTGERPFHCDCGRSFS